MRNAGKLRLVSGKVATQGTLGGGGGPGSASEADPPVTRGGARAGVAERKCKTADPEK